MPRSCEKEADQREHHLQYCRAFAKVLAKDGKHKHQDVTYAVKKHGGFALGRYYTTNTKTGPDYPDGTKSHLLRSTVCGMSMPRELRPFAYGGEVL